MTNISRGDFGKGEKQQSVAIERFKAKEKAKLAIMIKLFFIFNMLEHELRQFEELRKGLFILNCVFVQIYTL